MVLRSSCQCPCCQYSASLQAYWLTTSSIHTSAGCTFPSRRPLHRHRSEYPVSRSSDCRSHCFSNCPRSSYSRPALLTSCPCSSSSLLRHVCRVCGAMTRSARTEKHPNSMMPTRDCCRRSLHTGRCRGQCAAGPGAGARCGPVAASIPWTPYWTECAVFVWMCINGGKCGTASHATR